MNLDDPAIYEQIDPSSVHRTLSIAPEYAPSVAAAINPAKRSAGQIMERVPILLAVADALPAAYYWQRQLNGLAKQFAVVQSLSNFATFGSDGLFFPQNLNRQLTVLILNTPAAKSAADAHLIDTARLICMHMGIAVDVIAGQGDNSEAQTTSLLILGDYVAYYVAIANGVDPALRPATAEFQARLAHPPSS